METLFFTIEETKQEIDQTGKENGDIKISALIPLSTAGAKSRNGVKGRSGLADAVLRRRVALPKVCPRKKSFADKKIGAR